MNHWEGSLQPKSFFFSLTDWLPIRRQSIATVRLDLEGQRALFGGPWVFPSGKNTVLPKGIIDFKWVSGMVLLVFFFVAITLEISINNCNSQNFFSVFDCSAVSCTLTALTFCDHLSMQLGIDGIRLWMVILFVFFYGKETIFFTQGFTCQ